METILAASAARAEMGESSESHRPSKHLLSLWCPDTEKPETLLHTPSEGQTPFHVCTQQLFPERSGRS